VGPFITVIPSILAVCVSGIGRDGKRPMGSFHSLERSAMARPPASHRPAFLWVGRLREFTFEYRLRQEKQATIVAMHF